MRLWYSSKDSPDVNSAINAAARWMSKMYFFASSRIEERLGKVQRFEEIGIPDGYATLDRLNPIGGAVVSNDWDSATTTTDDSGYFQLRIPSRRTTNDSR